MDCIIRPYRPEDFAALSDIHDSARPQELRLAGLSNAFLPLRIAAPREGLFDYKVIVAELTGKVAGFAAYGDGELARLYVHPQHMRRGVGSALARYAIGDMGGVVTLEVLAGNAPAVALYERLGFRIVRTVSGRMPGNEAFAVTVHEMQREG